MVLIVGGKMSWDSIMAVSPAPPPAVSSPGATTPTVAGVAPATPGAIAASPPPTTGAYILDGRMGGATPNGRDPFTPVSDEILAKASVRPKNFIPTPAPSPTPAGVPRLPIVQGGIAKSFRDGMNALNQRDKALDEIGLIDKAPVIPPPTVRVLPPPPPPYTVSGVLIGEPGGRDVAILRHDGTENEKRFVVVGDSLEGGYTVSAIESGGVIVKHPGRRPSTTVIPGAPPAMANGVEYKLKQTITVPAATRTLPLEAAPGTPGANRAK